MDVGKIIVTVVNALGTLGQKYSHLLLDALETFVTDSKTPVDNALFYKTVTYVQSWKPKKLG